MKNLQVPPSPHPPSPSPSHPPIISIGFIISSPLSKVKIRDVHIRYEDNQTNPFSTIAAGVTLSSLELKVINNVHKHRTTIIVLYNKCLAEIKIYLRLLRMHEHAGEEWQ